MYGKDTRKTTFLHLLYPVMGESIKQKIKESGVDRYVKKLFGFKLVIILIFAMLNKCRSLRDIASHFDNDEFQEFTGLKSISHSQISRRLRVFPPQLARFIYNTAVAELRKELSFKPIKQRPILKIVDSSVITCAVKKFLWARFRKTKAGIKIHLKIDFSYGHSIPEDNTVTTQNIADNSETDNLVVNDEDTIHVLDRAYVDYARFDRYCDENTLFVTRLKSNAVKTVIEEYPAGGVITRYQKVILGNGKKKMRNPLLLIETKDSEGTPITIITNDFQRSCTEIAEIYRNRWQIEIFFKWVKQNLEIKHFYGTSPRAVETQLLMALTTYCLLLLVKLRYGVSEDLLKIKRCFIACLYEEFETFLRKILKKPTRTSRGRKKIDYEGEFKEIERQVMSGEANHLLMV